MDAPDSYWLLFGHVSITPDQYVRHGPIPRDLAYRMAALEGTVLVVYWDDGKFAWLGTPAARSADLARDLWPRVYKAVESSVAGMLMDKAQLRRVVDRLVKERDVVKLKQYGVEI